LDQTYKDQSNLAKVDIDLLPHLLGVSTRREVGPARCIWDS